MGNFRTPLIAIPRADGSTFYTFSSALEDIGLNINERNNKVRLSHYVLLDLPPVCFEAQTKTAQYLNTENFFADSSVSTEYTNFKDQLKNSSYKQWFTVPFQNYMMNAETTLRNQGTYDHSSSATVTERCFWKYLQHAGAINFVDNSNTATYYHEKWDASNIDNTVIKGFGAITSSSQSSNQYNINNETYVMLPSSYGQMKYILKAEDDNNLIIGTTYPVTNEETLLEGHHSTEGDTSLLLPLSDSYGQSSNNYYTIGTKDNLRFVFDTDVIKTQLVPTASDATISYDDLAINHSIASEYKFNSILIYYTIYDTVGNQIATNLYGLWLLNDLTQCVNVSGRYLKGLYQFGEITKKKSTTGNFGSSYFFRLNTQTASIYDDTDATIIDYSTATSSTLTDFNEVISNLKTSVDILKNNAVVLQNVYTDTQATKELATQYSTKVDELEKIVNELKYMDLTELKTNILTTNELYATSTQMSEATIESLSSTTADIESAHIKSLTADSIVSDTLRATTSKKGNVFYI